MFPLRQLFVEAPENLHQQQRCQRTAGRHTSCPYHIEQGPSSSSSRDRCSHHNKRAIRKMALRVLPLEQSSAWSGYMRRPHSCP